MKRTIAFILALVLSLAVTAGCSNTAAPAPSQAAPSSQEAASSAPEASSSAPEAEPQAEITKLIVGLDDTFAPMGFRDEANNLVGFDIDLATAVGEQMGVEIVFQPIDWDSKEMELEAKKIDCIWNGMSRTPQREESMTLSQNYLNNKIVIMTLPDVKIETKEQLKDYNIGTQAKSSALEIVQADEVYDSIKDKLSEYRTYDECILDMQAGRIQAMIVDEVLGQYKNNNLETKFNVSTVDFGDDFYVIGFRKSDTELCNKVEEAIKAVAASGKGREISEKWFGENLLLDLK